MRQFLSLVLAFMVSLTINAQRAELSTTPFSLKKMDGAIVKSPTQEQAQGSLELRYCEKTMATSLGGTQAGTIQVGVYFPAELVSKYAGAEMTKVVLGVANYASSNVKLNISKTVGGASVYSQNLTLTRNSWNNIALTTPYLLKEGEGIFITIEATYAAGAYPLGMCNGTEFDGGYINAGGTWYSFQEYFGSYVMALYGIIEGELPENEMTLTGIEASKYIDTTTASFDLNGTIRNDGLDKITSFDVSYSINGGEPVSSKISSVNVASMATYTFTLKIAEDIELANNSINVKVSNPNGVADVETDNEASTSVIGYDPTGNNETRKVLLEHFTTAQCTYCPAAQTRWTNVLSTRENVLWVSHHTGYYTDDYTIEESEAYLWFYNSGGTYAPASMLDRTNLNSYGSGSGNSAVFSPSTETLMTKLVDHQLTFPPFVTIDVQRNYDNATRELSLLVNTNKIKGMTLDENPVLNIFLTEDGLVGYQMSGGNNYVHNHVIRDVVTATWGDALSFDASGTATKEYTYTIPAAWKTENMKVIIFVSNEDANNPNNCNVYNAEGIVLEGSIGPAPVTGVVLSDEEVLVGINATYQLTASVKPSYANNKNISWSSSNADIASVDQNGLVTGKALGEATITVTTEEGGYTAECKVTVYRGVESVSLNKETLDLAIDETFQFIATVLPEEAPNKEVTWSYGASGILKYSTSSPGLVKGGVRGETTVTVTTEDGGFTASCNVKVYDPVGIGIVPKDEPVGSVYTKDNSLYVNVNATGNVSIDLFDISGKKIQSYSTSLNGKGLIVMPVNSVSGVYLLKVSSADETVVKKIVL